MIALKKWRWRLGLSDDGNYGADHEMIGTMHEALLMLGEMQSQMPFDCIHLSIHRLGELEQTK